jgi:hypothetical protein
MGQNSGHRIVYRSAPLAGAGAWLPALEECACLSQLLESKHYIGRCPIDGREKSFSSLGEFKLVRICGFRTGVALIIITINLRCVHTPLYNPSQRSNKAAVTFIKPI